MTDRITVGEEEDKTNGSLTSTPVEMHDARPLHASTITEADAREAFRLRGFTILPQKTEVVDWNEDYMKGMLNPFVSNDIKYKYAPEIEGIIRNVLLPEYHCVEVQCHGAVLKRGPGSLNNFYGTGVHQDYGLTPEDIKCTMRTMNYGATLADNFQASLDAPGVTGVMVINFWRPINLKAPWDKLQQKPLAVLDPNSVNAGDPVFTSLDYASIGIGEGLSSQMTIRANPEHKWYYYPEMTNDEVLIFKQFEWFKGDSVERSEVSPSRSVFHTAFVHPDTPAECPPRNSTEYRVMVFVGAKKTEDEMKVKWANPPRRSCICF